MMLKKYKKIRFSGSGTSHQNGAAERAIKTLVTMERNMLMHSVILDVMRKHCPMIFG